MGSTIASFTSTWSTTLSTHQHLQLKFLLKIFSFGGTGEHVPTNPPAVCAFIVLYRQVFGPRNVSIYSPNTQLPTPSRRWWVIITELCCDEDLITSITCDSTDLCTAHLCTL